MGSGVREVTSGGVVAGGGDLGGIGGVKEEDKGGEGGEE